MGTLRKSFPFRGIFESFLDDYARSATYWYIPKARALNDENVGAMAAILKVVFDEFLERVWNVETQDVILARLVELDIVKPSRSDSKRADYQTFIKFKRHGFNVQDT